MMDTPPKSAPFSGQKVLLRTPRVGCSLFFQDTTFLYEYVPTSPVLSLAFFFATGSRFDPPGKGGLAHWVEHLVFKGTQSFSAEQLARFVDGVGGDLNAWTDREEMGFSCVVPAQSWSVAVKALVELCFKPTFPEAELEREREVVRNEILASLEEPEELAYDVFLARQSPGDWSRPVAGTEESLSRLTRTDVLSWWQDFVQTFPVTIVASGGVTPELLETALQSALRSVRSDLRPPQRPIAPLFNPQKVVVCEKADFQMCQVMGSVPIPRPTSSRSLILWQTLSMLWGETMSSRLFQSIREQQGLCYQITSQVFDTAQSWAMHFFAACAIENVVPMVAALQRAVNELSSLAPSAAEWEGGRLALKGGLILASERMENRMQKLWRQYQFLGTVETYEETLEQLDLPITDSEAAEWLAQWQPTLASLLVFGPVNKKIGTEVQRLWQF